MLAREMSLVQKQVYLDLSPPPMILKALFGICPVVL